MRLAVENRRLREPASKEAAEEVESVTSAAKAAKENRVVIAALKRCATQNQTFSAAYKGALTLRQIRDVQRRALLPISTLSPGFQVEVISASYHALTQVTTGQFSRLRNFPN